ncbi:hypothetical protein K7X08_023198 [Anisodus acutangulus]|uniref:Uncharacterized protein n=1 Tax=Anisodus acutangulus TaxID=402998 RepID=A0A9Q1LHZ6_9SOLA|nr:hypothetical protein K7X08_023198 [Anisodus acutangulus]
MHLKKIASRTSGKIDGRGVRVDLSTSSYLPSTSYVGDEDDDDFESPAPTNNCQQESTRITRSQTKKVDKLVKNIKTRSKKCDRPEKAKVSLKLVDEDEDDSAKVKKKVENVAEGSSFAITKEERISTRCKFKERKSLLKVVPGAERELWIKLNGCVLSFGIGEFDENVIFRMLLYSRQYLVVRVGNNVPRILNWQMTDSPTYAGLTNGVIMPSLDKMKYCNICPSN